MIIPAPVPYIILVTMNDHESDAASLEHPHRAPASFAQERLWFLEQLTPGTIMHNLVSLLRFQGLLDIDVLASVLEGILRRHESLRTTISSASGTPYQVVHPPRAFPLSVDDLEVLPEHQRNRRLRSIVVDEAESPFDLSIGPLFRARLVRLTETEHMLILAHHHMVTDAWSHQILVRELATRYRAALEDAPADLPPLAAQYADFAVWQRDYLAGDILDSLLNYWRTQLDGGPSTIDLPSDFRRPTLQSYRGSHAATRLGAEVVAKLRAIGRSGRATMFMTTLAVFQSFLSRVTGQDDIIVGTPSANRSNARFQDVIGFFANTLAIRAQFSGAPTFLEVLARVRDATIAALVHQDLPFQHLVADLRPERNTSHHPILQVMFTLRNALDNPHIKMGPVSVEPLDQLQTTATFGSVSMFDLAMDVVCERDGSMSVYLEYASDLFDERTVNSWLDTFKALATEIARHPQERVIDLPSMSAAQARIVVGDWNKTAVVPPRASAVEMFEKWADSEPHSAAVIEQRSTSSYRQLNTLADELAQHLRWVGVTREVPVAVCLDRTLTSIASLFAVWKAGGAYVPLDPKIPTERQRYILQDSGARVVVSQGPSTPIELPTSVTVLDVNSVDVRGHKSMIRGAPGLRDLAYIIYTSGSTGRPKGVAVEHLSLANYVSAARKIYTLRPGDRTLPVTSMMFDWSIEETVLPLCSGGTVVLANETGLLAPDQYFAELKAGGITILTTPVAFLTQVVSALERGDALPPSVRLLVTGGERVPPDLWARWDGLGYDVPLVNTYGPTEATIIATYHVMEPGVRLLGETPIGRPIDNTRVYVLDSDYRPVPPGVRGEVFIGGMGVARGYLNNLELTAGSFLSDPLSDMPNSRMYRTGDFGKFGSDGTLYYLGRADHQIKVRGFRIELGEIESVLAQHPRVAQAVLRLSDEDPPRLLAYVVASTDSVVSSQDLRMFLRSKLPDYMLPAAFIPVDTIPLGPTGKIDTKALPQAPVQGRSEAEPFSPPRTDTERKLAAVISEVLRIADVSRTDNFFELGGDSISSIQVVARAAQEGIRMSPKQIYEGQTIEAIAEASVQGQGSGSSRRTSSSNELLPLSPNQSWFVEQEFTDPYRLSIELEFRLKTDPVLLQRCLHELVRRHDALRLRFRQNGKTWWQTVSPATDDDLMSVIDLTSLDPQEQALRVREVLQSLHERLNLFTGPLVRFALLQCFGDEDVLVAVIHHLGFDGVSCLLFEQELRELLRQLEEGSNPSLPAVLAFSEWVTDLEAYAQTDQAAAELPFWRETMEHFSAHLPVDYPDGYSQAPRPETLYAPLSEDDTRALMQLFRDGESRHDALLLSSLTVALQRWMGAPVRINIDIHGREEIAAEIDASRTIGWIASYCPVVLPSEDPNPRSVLENVSERLARLPSGGIGYGILRYLTKGPASEFLRRSPPQQVFFNYEGMAAPLADVGDVPLRTPRLVQSGESILPRREGQIGVEGREASLLVLHVQAEGGRLVTEFLYNSSLLRRDTITSLVDSYAAAIRGYLRS